jgi:hypothetical protein
MTLPSCPAPYNRGVRFNSVMCNMPDRWAVVWKQDLQSNAHPNPNERVDVREVVNNNRTTIELVEELDDICIGNFGNCRRFGFHLRIKEVEWYGSRRTESAVHHPTPFICLVNSS